MGRLTTHVLDTALGEPAAGLTVELWSLAGSPTLMNTVVTNRDGRTDEPMLAGEALKSGTYELRFHAGAYHRRSGLTKGAPPFLDVIPVRFGIADASLHYHVPLLLSPYGYSTYRGS